ncbi:hypothetical protein C8R46DRAFT_1212793 [Mycena filopes]|nr:hypothetical protein C8R46DRAFT_1212793 [Mycena filopes]
MFNPPKLLLFLLTAVLTNVAASPSSCMGIVCPAVDKSNSPLILNSPSQHDANGQQSVISCQYGGSPACTYQSPDDVDLCTFELQQLDSKTCPPQFGEAVTGQCPFVNNVGAPLRLQESLADPFPFGSLSCKYFPVSEPDDACIYVNPNFAPHPKAGNPGTCPSSLEGPHAPTSNSCPPVDPSNNRLTSETTNGSSIICNFFNANGCTYDATTGAFLGIGPKQTCPSAIKIKAPAPAVALKGSALSLAAAAAAAVDPDPAASTSKSSTVTAISKPILIALLAMNAALVLAVLTMAGVWFFGGRTSASFVPRRESGYRSVGSKAVPRTHSDDS